MHRRLFSGLILIGLVVTLILPAAPSAGQDGDDNLIDNFEGNSFDELWWSNAENSDFACNPTTPGHNSNTALQLTYALQEGQYPNCGFAIDHAPVPGSDGFSFWWRGDRPGLSLSLIVFMDDPSQTNRDSVGQTPFEAYLVAPVDAWGPTVLYWDNFVKARWVGDAGTSTLDPAHITRILFEPETGSSGTLWLDDIRAERVATTALLDDMEANVPDRWWGYTDDGAFTCGPATPGYESNSAVSLDFTLEDGQYPGCGTNLDSEQLAQYDGLTFWWRGSQTELGMTLILVMNDPTQTNPDTAGETPFYVWLETRGDQWRPMHLDWTRFRKSEWVGETGAATLDPSQVVAMIFQPGDDQQGTLWFDDLMLFDRATPVLTSAPPPSVAYDRFALWTGPTQLRGANIWQRIVVPEIDGDYLGSGYVGPPYTQDDFHRLATLGANYVHISGPGLFTERPPYQIDDAAVENLDNLLAMIEAADMFAVISFRTGPGRSDFTFYDDGIEEWGDPALVIDDVWTDQMAQGAWGEMWRFTAERYRDNPVVVGYHLMVEPNGPGRLLGIFDPYEFYPEYAGTTYDWNQFYPRLIEEIRLVDDDTPILVGASGWSAVFWLPFLEVVDDPRVVYTVHQYEPQDLYTHQEPDGTNTYPGFFDADQDGTPEDFDRAWLDDYLLYIDQFTAGVPVAVTEFGVVRWVPGAADFMNDEIALFEQRGINWALWMFSPAWPPHAADNDAFDFLHGPDPDNHSNVLDNELAQIIGVYWSLNTARPSTMIAAR